MDLRSAFWGSKVNKSDAFAAKQISNSGPRKVGLKIIFRLWKENLYVKAGPSQNNNFSLSPKGRAADQGVVRAKMGTFGGPS